ILHRTRGDAGFSLYHVGILAGTKSACQAREPAVRGGGQCTADVCGGAEGRNRLGRFGRPSVKGEGAMASSEAALEALLQEHRRFEPDAAFRAAANAADPSLYARAAEDMEGFW